MANAHSIFIIICRLKNKLLCTYHIAIRLVLKIKLQVNNTCRKQLIVDIFYSLFFFLFYVFFIFIYHFEDEIISSGLFILHLKFFFYINNIFFSAAINNRVVTELINVTEWEGREAWLRTLSGNSLNPK